MGYSSVNLQGKGEGVLANLKRYAGVFVGSEQSNDTYLSVKTIALAKGAGGVYGVDEYTPRDGTPVFHRGYVIKIEQSGGEFAWKFIGECAGPTLCAIPAKILKTLDEHDNLQAQFERGQLTEDSLAYAREWRSKARTALERKARLAVGAVLQFASPYTFSGVPVHKFEVKQLGAAKRFLALPDNGGQPFLCRLPKDALFEEYTFA